MPYLLVLGVPFGLSALGFFVDKTGEGIESASNGLVKVAVVGVGSYIVLKKMKVV